MLILRALALVLLLGSGIAVSTHAQTRDPSDACLPFAVATAPQTPGQPLTANEIVVTSIDGVEIARAEFDEPMQVLATTFPARSMVRSLGGDYGILQLPDNDSTMGMVSPLLAFEDRPSVQYGGPAFTVPDGSQFVLFHDAAELSAYLVDLISGAGLPISEFVGEPGHIISAEVAQGDEWLAAWTGQDIILFDFAAGSTTESLGNGDTLSYPSFSSDGDTLFFLRRGSDDQSLIVARDMASGIETTLVEKEDWFGLQHFPSDILVVQTPGELHRVAVDGSGTTLLLESGAELQPRMIDPAGRNLLVSVSSAESDEWVLVDLEGTSDSIALPDLSGLFLNLTDPIATWVLMEPSQSPQLAVPGAWYATVNLETGATQVMVEQSGDGIYFANAPRSDDGRYSTVWSLSPAIGQLWLVDAEQGTSELIASSTGSAVGAVTPDGCYLAVGTFDTIGEGRQGSVQVIDLETRLVTTEIEDAILLGWAYL